MASGARNETFCSRVVSDLRSWNKTNSTSTGVRPYKKKEQIKVSASPRKDKSTKENGPETQFLSHFSYFSAVLFFYFLGEAEVLFSQSFLTPGRKPETYSLAVQRGLKLGGPI